MYIYMIGILTVWRVIFVYPPTCKGPLCLPMFKKKGV